MNSYLKLQRGFTLIELVITVVILGILSAVALPSFTSFLGSIQVRSTSEATLQGLQLARAEAIRRNTRVRFEVTSGSSWTVSTDAGTEIQNKPAKEGSMNVVLAFTPGTASRITFNSFGRVVPNSGGSATLTQIRFSAPGTSVARRIDVNTGGQLHLCDPSVSATTDPRTC